MSGRKNRGKKFNAAEKHFMAKEEKLRREAKNAAMMAKSDREEARRMYEENEALRARVEELTAENTKLIEISKLSEEDRKLLLEQIRGFKNMDQLLGTLARIAKI